ncbi:MAG: AgmX/PglI C-terminal domain-containing protein, partial [Deltaproteobacteria bacterium]|nr:AgmX/PglI C-terminal domain-containing protein [Deltaproteobacteria bacterium]
PCVTHVPVLFSNAQIPPAPKEEVEMKANLPPGFCDKDAVKKVILGRSGAYRACYEIELQRRPELTGKIELRWVIDFDGSVVEIVVLSDGLNNKGVMDCLTKNIKQLKFLKPEGGVCVIRWPFVFTPK